MDKAELVTEIIDLQRQLNRFQREESLGVWMELSLTIPQLKSLLFIVNERSTSPTKLATALRVTPSNVTGIVDRLVEQGLLRRSGNPEDRRVLLLQATEKGETVVANLRERRAAFLSGALGRLSLKELTALARGLLALVRAAQSHEGEGDEANRG